MDKYQILERYFGYREFRPGQEALIDGALAGRDVFGIMPTGGGKSVCYQVPGLMMPGITLVISPLISLMRDQVMTLKAMGIPAAYINSTLSAEQMRAVYRNLAAGQYKIVYVTPERLDYSGFGEIVSRLQVSFLAVDEAHCISQWGQDFRPSYLRIVDFIRGLPRRPVVGAFTATATAQVRQDVERILELQDPVRTMTGFDRPNLFFDVLTPEGKDETLRQLLATRREKSGIIYCATRKKVESVCQMLLDWGYEATRYHAGLEEGELGQNQEDFLYDRSRVMVATNAFGMGIDKSNVSYVIHYNMPKSMEAYYQEAGRAGRDGSEAECILLYSPGDVQMAKYLIANAGKHENVTPEQQTLLREQELVRLGAMVAYCQSRDCLRGYILQYFGQEHPEACGHCGVCSSEFQPVDITRESQMILSCARRAYDKAGMWVSPSMLAKILQGSREKGILELGLEEISTFGLLPKVGRSRIRSMIDHLILEGYLTQEDTALRLMAQAGQVLFHGKKVIQQVRKEMLPQEGGTTEAGVEGLSEQEQDLYEELRILRGEIARREQVPAYVVFSNSTLGEMARKKPQNSTQFRRISGVGEMKARWYAKPFLERIREWEKEVE